MKRVYSIPGDIGEEVIVTRTGEIAKIVGFNERWVHPGRVIPSKPGMYVDWDYPIIELSSGSQLDTKYLFDPVPAANGRIRGATNLVWLEPLPGMAPQHRSDVWLRDLPDTAFWHGDLVSLPDGRQGAIHNIWYSCINGNSRGDWKAYDVLDPDGDNFKKLSFEEKELSLVKRGNFYRHHHGQHLEFPELVDEVVFHVSMGWSTALLRGHRRESIAYDKGLKIVRSGEADVLWDNSGRLSEYDYLNGVYAHVLHDRELGERYRLDFLARLDDPAGPRHFGRYCIDHAVDRKLREIVNTIEGDEEREKAEEAAARASGGPDIIIRFS